MTGRLESGVPSTQAFQDNNNVADLDNLKGKAGGTQGLGSRKPCDSTIPDDQEPIAALENEIKKRFGIMDLTKIPHLDIKGTFVKDEKTGAAIITPFKDPPQSTKAPYCYSFERKWTVSYKDATDHVQSFTVSKRIFTTVAIPTASDDPNLHRLREDAALRASSTYSKVVESGVYIHAGQPSKAAFGITAEHITKIQKDNFIALSLYHGKKRLSPNKASKAPDSSTTPITHVFIHIRAANSKDKNEAGDDVILKINLLSDKIGGVYAKDLNKPPKRCLIEPDDQSSVEIKQLATLQKFRFIQSQDEPRDIIEALRNEEINENSYCGWVEEENKRHFADFQDNLDLLTNPARIQTLRNTYSPGFTPVSDEVKSLFPKGPGKAGKIAQKLKLKKKEQPKELLVLNTLVEAWKSAPKGPEKEDLAVLVACCYKAYNKMEELHHQLDVNEDSLAQIEPQNAQNLGDRLKARRNTLEDVKEALEDVPPSIIQKAHPEMLTNRRTAQRLQTTSAEDLPPVDLGPLPIPPDAETQSYRLQLEQYAKEMTTGSERTDSPEANLEAKVRSMSPQEVTLVNSFIESIKEDVRKEKLPEDGQITKSDYTIVFQDNPKKSFIDLNIQEQRGSAVLADEQLSLDKIDLLKMVAAGLKAEGFTINIDTADDKARIEF